MNKDSEADVQGEIDEDGDGLGENEAVREIVILGVKAEEDDENVTDILGESEIEIEAEKFVEIEAVEDIDVLIVADAETEGHTVDCGEYNLF